MWKPNLGEEKPLAPPHSKDVTGFSGELRGPRQSGTREGPDRWPLGRISRASGPQNLSDWVWASPRGEAPNEVGAWECGGLPAARGSRVRSPPGVRRNRRCSGRRAGARRSFSAWGGVWRSGGRGWDLGRFPGTLGALETPAGPRPSALGGKLDYFPRTLTRGAWRSAAEQTRTARRSRAPPRKPRSWRPSRPGEAARPSAAGPREALQAPAAHQDGRAKGTRPRAAAGPRVFPPSGGGRGRLPAPEPRPALSPGGKRRWFLPLKLGARDRPSWSGKGLLSP